MSFWPVRRSRRVNSWESPAMSVLNQSGEEQVECPLCMEPLEVDDLNFFPCTCGYQICRFCWHRIRTDENGLCPACRKAYPENPADFKPLSQEEVARLKAEKRHKDQQRKQKITENRKHLANVRVVQRNLVFVVGLPMRLADPEVLKKHEYFGKFGKIHKVVINQSTSYAGSQGPSASAYVTYHKADDALRAIQAVNNISVDGRTLKASLGTTKYCSHFMKNQPCPKPDCMYLHDLGDSEASFTKEEMQQGKHQEYEKKLHDQLLNACNKERKPTPSPPAVAVSGGTCPNSTGGFGTGTVPSGSAGGGSCGGSGPSKGEGAQRRQKCEQQSSSRGNGHKKRHTSGEENRGRKTKEKSHSLSEDNQHKLNHKPGSVRQQPRHGKGDLSRDGNNSRTSTSLSEGDVGSESSDCPEAEGLGEAASARGRLRAAAQLFESDNNNSFFSANGFTKVPPPPTTTAASTTGSSSDWQQNGLAVTHMPDVLPPVHSSEDWQAAFGFADSPGNTPPADVAELSQVPGNVKTDEVCEDRQLASQVFNGPIAHSVSLDSVVPPKLVQRSIPEDYMVLEHLGHNGSSLGPQDGGKIAGLHSNGNPAGFPSIHTPAFVQDPGVFLLRQQQMHHQLLAAQHLIPNGLAPSQVASKLLADFHLRQQAQVQALQQSQQQIHSHSSLDRKNFVNNFVANGTSVNGKFSEYGGRPDGSVPNGSGCDKLSNGDGGTNEKEGALNEEKYLNFANVERLKSNPEVFSTYFGEGSDRVVVKEDRLTDDLDFDPFQETQKALAEMMEKENLQGVQNAQHHNLILAHGHVPPQMFPQHAQQFGQPPALPTFSGGSKVLASFASVQHVMPQQNQRLLPNMSVSGCAKLLDGLALAASPPNGPSPVPRPRLPPPPPGFATTPNHMNAFGLGIPRALTNPGSKILPFMGLNNQPNATSNGPPSPTAAHSQAALFQPSGTPYGLQNGSGGLLLPNASKSSPGEAYTASDWPESVRALLPGVAFNGTSASVVSSQGAVFGVHAPVQPNSQKAWTGSGPCTDWTALDPAIIPLPSHWLQDGASPQVVYAGGEWTSATPAPASPAGLQHAPAGQAH
ncbi:uncharacterized protein LOC134534877 isoform X3 [Bacillus rossius redtenbacheri]|uniref:uncharacterized protein LOC134534877 isoform X3 n=2 Tax=Bacillus rossius redtenbacheri TaxID=93214 RepID=UPI002FDE0A59